MSEVSLNLRTGTAAVWIEEVKAADEIRKSALRAELTPEALAELRAWSAGRSHDLQQTARRERDLEVDRKNRRDGYSVRDYCIPGFYASCRERGMAKILWGSDLANGDNHYRVVSFHKGLAKWTCRLDQRIQDAWIGGKDGDFLIQVTLPDLPDLMENEQHNLFMFFSGATGLLKFHFQHNRNVRVLGISEEGDMYARMEKSRIHVANMPPKEDLFIWELPSHLYPNMAVFLKEEKAVRLLCSHGHFISYCWEDFSGFYHEQVDQALLGIPDLEKRGSMIMNEWNNATCKGGALAEVLLRRLDEIPLEEIREESFCGIDWPRLLQMKVEMLEAFGRSDELQLLKAKLAEFRGPFQTSDEALGSAEDAVRSGDIARLESLKSKLLFALNSKVLQKHEFRLAKLNRALGYIAESAGEFADAIQMYESALALDPNVGCKMALKKLLKRNVQL